MSGSPPPPPPARNNASSSSTPTSSEDSRWKKWGKTAFDKSIVVSDWASGYANSASAKLGGERFWPKSNDFPDEIAKCERILRAFTVEGVEAKPSASNSGASTPNHDDKEDSHDADHTELKKEGFMKKKRKVLRKIPPAVIKRAKGIVIYTAMRSGIAPFGGAGGAGLMLARLPDGSWSAPSSISPNNLALGLLLGFDIFDVILVVNTDHAMETFKSHKVTLGAETAVAAGPFGTGISGEMGIDRSPVFSYVRSRGLYGGVEAIAQAFLHRFDENERIYYWPGITARDILEGKVRKPPIVDPLYRALRDAETGIAQGDSLERTVYEAIHAPPNIAVRQLQQEESADLLQDGERLKLPPTPEELEAMEEAGIPDEFDLALEKKEREEAERRASELKREIMALPPPPTHKKVVGYWQARGTKPGGKRRVAPSPLHNEAEPEKTPLSEDEQEAMELIDLNDEASKPALPPRPPQVVESLADELERTSLDAEFQDASQTEWPSYEEDGSANPVGGDSKSSAPGSPALPLPSGALDRSVSASPPPLVVTGLVDQDASMPSPHDPESVLPTDLTSEPLSRSTSLTRPSRPPRRAPRTLTNPSTPATSTFPSPPLRLFLDWDETITSSDTLSLIAPPEGTQLHGPPFSSYTEAYLFDLSAFDSSFGDRENWARQLEYFEKLDDVEVKSVTRVEEGGLFRGMAKSDLVLRAESMVEFRDGWDEFYSWLHSQVMGDDVGADVISVGWSGEFIHHAILTRSGGHVAINKVYANEVEMDDSNNATGKLTKSSPLTLLDQEHKVKGAIRTGIDKLNIMNALTETAHPSTVRVYVGDSNTDLPCMVNADYGLLMKKSDGFEESSINKTIQKTNPPVKRFFKDLQEFLAEDKQDETAKEGHGGVLIRIDDWTQALQVIKKIQGQTAPTTL